MSKPARPRANERAAKRPLATRRTPSEKSELLELLDRDSVSGLTVEKIAAKHRISTASYYRWHRDRDKFEREKFRAFSIDKTSIEQAIQNICFGNKASPISIVDSIFQLMTWMRWPSENELYVSAMINCLSSYLLQKRSITILTELPEEDLHLIGKYLTLETAVLLSSPNGILNPSFEIITNGKSRYSDRDFYAQIINYLLSDPIKVGRKLHRPSLGRLEMLVSERAFGKNWAMTSRTFNKHWRLRAPSSPFLYVEQYHSSFDWSLNPLDPDFAQNVDELLENSSSLREYLGKVKWVILELQRILDVRATRHIAFPCMPESLVPVRVANPLIDSRLEAKIRSLL